MTDLKTTLNTLNHQDVWTRALLTAIQAFLASWALTGNKLTKDALVGAGGAGLAALYHYIKQLSTPHITPPSSI